MEANPYAIASIEELRELSTCLVASAIETLHVRLPNTGFTDSSIHCIYEDLPPMAAYAATARIRTADPPMEGRGYSYARTDWWNHILSIPVPRVMVIEDIDKPPGRGAFVGEVNANVLKALGCVGLVTNGAVRDIDEVRAIEFPLFASSRVVSHSYAHIFDFGGPVIVGGLTIQPGELVHADIHGVQTVPLKIAWEIPGIAREIRRRRKQIVHLCKSPGVTAEALRTMVTEKETETETETE